MFLSYKSRVDATYDATSDCNFVEDCLLCANNINKTAIRFMPSLIKRNKHYSIVFAKRKDGKLIKRTFALNTKVKKNAEKKFLEYSHLFEMGEFDPFNQPLPNPRADLKSVQKEVRLDKVAELFIKSRTNCGDVSKNNYRRHLKMLKDQVGETFPVTQLTEEDIDSYCFKPHLSPYTQKSYLTHIRQFCKWLRDEGLLSTDISAKLKPPKPPENIYTKIINETQFKRVLHEFRKELLAKKRSRQVTKPHQMQTWFRPVAHMAFYQGLRAGEMVRLQWADINFEGNNFVVRTTKIRKGRIVPFYPETRAILLAWHRFSGKPKSGLVFPSVKSTKTTQLPMCPRSTSRTIKHYLRAAELPESVNLHGLRHSRGTILHDSGYSFDNLGKFLGNGPGATEKYIHSVQANRQISFNEIIEKRT